MSRVQHISVTDDEDGMRLDRWFKVHFPGISHGQLEKLLRKGEVRVGGGRSKSNRRLMPGDSIRIPPIAPPPPTASGSSSSESDRRALAEMTVYEDDHLLAINKPFGLAVQGGAKTNRHVDGLLQATANGTVRPRLVHRLDKDTGGLLLVAKTRIAAQRLTDAFKRQEIEKTYWALLVGTPRPKEGTIDLPIAKQMTGRGERVQPTDGKDGKRAVTLFQTVDMAGPVSFVAMRPLTGRTHQLRVHTAAIGRPIAGDRKYGGDEAMIDGISQKLHLFCRTMTFRHPHSGAVISLSADLSGHMAKTWNFFGFDADAAVEWPENL